MSEIEAKEYLQQVRNADIAVNNKMEELAGLEALATKINALNEGDRVQATGSQDKMADTVCKIADLKAEIQAEIDSLLALKRVVRGVIKQVSEPVLMSLLHKRYLQYKSWEQIAIELDISWRHTLRLHGKALQEIEKILNVS
ncbi:MAG: hypothetical protein ACLRZ9_13075 [Eubacterium sp.]